MRSDILGTKRSRSESSPAIGKSPAGPSEPFSEATMDAVEDVGMDEETAIRMIGGIGVVVDNYITGMTVDSFEESYQGLKGEILPLHLYAEILQNVCDAFTAKMSKKHNITGEDVFVSKAYSTSPSVWCSDSSIIKVQFFETDRCKNITFHDRSDNEYLGEILVHHTGDVYTFQTDQQVLDIKKFAVANSKKGKKDDLPQAGTHGIGLKQLIALILYPEHFGVCLPYSRRRQG